MVDLTKTSILQLMKVAMYVNVWDKVGLVDHRLVGCGERLRLWKEQVEPLLDRENEEIHIPSPCCSNRIWTNKNRS